MSRIQATDELLGTCLDVDLIDDIFGSVSEFARKVEENGNEFKFGNILIKYDKKNDIHYFYKLV